jgi:hypothetical protein
MSLLKLLWRPNYHQHLSILVLFENFKGVFFMSSFWVVDTKVKILPESTLTLDGSEYYYTRSVVPSETEEEAVNSLKGLLEEKSIILSEVLSVSVYESKIWNSEEDEDFETVDSFEKSKKSGEISIGCVVSELSMED